MSEPNRFENGLWWALMEWEASCALLLKEDGVIAEEARQDIERIRNARHAMWPTKEDRAKFYANL